MPCSMKGIYSYPGFNEGYVENALLLRSLLRLSVRLSVCDALEL